MNKRSIILISVCAILMLALGIVLFNTFKKDEENIKQYDEFVYENYVILKGSYGKIDTYDKSLYLEGYQGSYDETYYINGTLKSNEDTKQNYVVIRFDLYDKDGSLLGEAVAGINDVEPNTEYKFKAMSLTTDENAKKVYKYNLKKIESK